MQSVGEKLRALRRRRSLNLRRLAERSGISHANLSLIERDKVSPSLNTLQAILSALGCRFSEFAAELEPNQPESPFYFRANQTQIGNPPKWSSHLIGFTHPRRQLMLLHEVMQPGADTGESYSHLGQEGGVIIRGAVAATIGDHTAILRAGDGYYFDSTQPHRFRVVGDEPCEIVSAATPPSY